VPLNFDLVGKAYPPVEVAVTAEQMERYARACGDLKECYFVGPGQVASPLFAAVPGLCLLATIVGDPELGVDNPLAVIHGEQEMVYHRPLRPGDQVVMKPSLEDIEDKGRNAVLRGKLAMSAEDGEPVADLYATIVVRGGGSGAERPPSERAAPPRGKVVATFSKHVDDVMPARYAEASGDHNPIHLDAAVARAVGLPGVINHGMGTLALVAAGLVDAVAGGDVSRLRRLAARFTDMVVPGTDLETTVWEAEENTFVFETCRPDDAVVVTGTLEVSSG
jgi:acyl dehydratase